MSGTVSYTVSDTVSGSAVDAVSGVVRHMTPRFEEFEVTWAVMKRHKPM